MWPSPKSRYAIVPVNNSILVSIKCTECGSKVFLAAWKVRLLWELAKRFVRTCTAPFIPLYYPSKKLVFWVSSKISLVKWISVPQCTQWLTFWRTNSAEGVLFHLLMSVDIWTCNSILKEIEGKNGRGRRCWKVLLLSSVQIKFSLMSRTCRQLPTVLSLKNESDMPRFFQAT